MRFSKTWLAFGLMLYFFSEEVRANTWQLEKEVGHVKVYTRQLETQRIKELRIVSTISGTSLDNIISLFKDVNSYQNWVYSCEEAVLLKKISESEILYYTRSNFPWPFEDRDFVVYNKVWIDSATNAFHSESNAHNEFIDEKSGIVRVTDFKAKWVITPRAYGKFDLVYEFSSDPKGNIPAWLVNSLIEVGPFQTIQNMETQAKKAIYNKPALTNNSVK